MRQHMHHSKAARPVVPGTPLLLGANVWRNRGSCSPAFVLLEGWWDQGATDKLLGLVGLGDEAGRGRRAEFELGTRHDIYSQSRLSASPMLVTG